MMQVLFFASLREQLDCDRREVPAGFAATAGELRDKLCDEGGTRWREHLGADNVICAVNQVICEGCQPLSDGDEIAFFPPVTGG